MSIKQPFERLAEEHSGTARCAPNLTQSADPFRQLVDKINV
jgi:hypothetical protein